MPDYRKMYLKLFAATEDAINALENGQPEKARDLLVQAQQQAEDLYVETSSQ
ncbi:MAG: hypothetical protein IJT18_07290 [Oscillospiraceae bacterium]|nr:hypothetical protein [Oscillospiraceae bacterium]